MRTKWWQSPLLLEQTINQNQTNRYVQSLVRCVNTMQKLIIYYMTSAATIKENWNCILEEQEEEYVRLKIFHMRIKVHFDGVVNITLNV